MKKRKKVLILILCVAFIVAVYFFINFMFGTYTTHSFHNYLSGKYYCDSSAENFMPQIDSVSDYEDISFTYQRKNYGLSTSNSYVLKIQYDDEHFEDKVKELKDNYVIFDTYCKSEKMYFCRCYDESFYFPFNFGMIGFDEERNTVMYLYFHDEENQNDDLEYIINEKFLDNNGDII